MRRTWKGGSSCIPTCFLGLALLGLGRTERSIRAAWGYPTPVDTRPQASVYHAMYISICAIAARGYDEAGQFCSNWRLMFSRLLPPDTLPPWVSWGQPASRHPVALAIGLLTCSLSVCPAAQGQPPEGTRAAQAEAARRAKAASLVEPRRSRVEAGLYYVEDVRLLGRLFNPPRGWFAQVGGVSEGNGFTVGGGYRMRTVAGTLSARAVGSLRRSHLVSVDLTRDFLPRDAGFVTATFTRRHEAAQRFYGAGPDSSFDDRSSFGLSATEADLVAGLRVTGWLTTSAGVGVVSPDVRRSSEVRRVQNTAVRFTDVEAPGLLRQPTFFTTHVGVTVDTRPTNNTRRGGLYQGQIRRLTDRDGGAYSFTQTRIDLQQFVPFWNESRLFAFRVLAEHAEGLGQAQVPFYMLPSLGGARTLRGYERQRFRDHGLVLVSAEYRYEVNAFLMAALFYDAGQVAPDWKAFRLRDVRSDYGIGFRFGSPATVALRSDIVFGGEDPVRLIIGFSTSF